MNSPFPLARTSGLLSEDVDGELLIYDETRDIACRLNSSAALVWRHCDGERTIQQLQDVLAERLDDLADEDMVLMALDDLLEHDLIASGYEPRDEFAARLSRRRFFRRAGVAGAAALAAPVVYSLTVPAAAAAISVVYAL